MSIEAAFFTASGEAKGKVELPEALFQAPGSRHVLHEAMVAYRGNLRRGTSETKTRSEVTGGGHKPWRQKGTGNARAGTIRSPLWRKGGIIFGPHPRSYRVDLSAEKRVLALKTALAEKAKTEAVGVMESLPTQEGKTRAVAEFLQKIGLSGQILIVVDKKDKTTDRAVRNIPHVRLIDTQELNALSLLNANRLLITQAAIEILSQRVLKG
jgi:large subunit ribosomal protein L4